MAFKNQTFGALVKELRAIHYNKKTKRHKFTPEERAMIHADCEGCCNECKTVLEIKAMQIDHILPLAMGGTNDNDNLQVLCKKCHFDKTKNEQENGYVKSSETESSFNMKTHEIFNSSLCNAYAFVESFIKPQGESYTYQGEIVNPENPLDTIQGGKFKGCKVIHVDLNRCRKNKMYFNNYDYPLFTVMDEVVEYKGDCSKPGLYNVENFIQGGIGQPDQCQYFPMRGNGWYNQPMITHCLKHNLIQESDIKYVTLSTLG